VRRIWNSKAMPGGWLQCISKTVLIGIGGHVEILRECSLDECDFFLRFMNIISAANMIHF